MESGLIGFILFLLFIATIFKKIISNLKFLPSKIGFISLVVLFWPIMSTGSLLKNWHGIETFMIIGLSIVLTKNIFKDRSLN